MGSRGGRIFSKAVASKGPSKGLNNLALDGLVESQEVRSILTYYSHYKNYYKLVTLK